MGFFDLFPKPFVIGALLLAALVIYLATIEPKCVHYTQGIIHHEGWVQYIPVGDIQVPIFHDGYDSVGPVCDQYEEEK